MIRALRYSMLALVPAAVATPQQPAVRWRHEARDIIDHTELTAFGTLLVSTSTATVALEPDSGRVVWSSSALRGCRTGGTPPATSCRFDGQGGYQLHLYDELPVALLARPDHLVAFDLHAGTERWRSDSAGFPRSEGGWRLEREFGAVLLWSKPDKESGTRLGVLDLLEGTPRWVTDLPLASDVELVVGRGVRLFAGKDRSGRMTVVAVEPETGTIRFVSEELGELFDRKRRRLATADPLAALGSPAVDYRAATGYELEMLSTDAKRLTGFDLASGSIKWQVEDVEVDAWVYDADAVYVVHDKELSAFQVADGSLLWSARTAGGPILSLTDHGLVVGCSQTFCASRIELVDRRTGQSLWAAPAELGSVSTAVLWKDDGIIAGLPKGVVRVDLARGDVITLAALEFRGNEGPRAINERANGFSVLGNQNVALLDSAGALQEHRYYRPPGLSTWDKIGRIALSSALTALSFAQASSSASSMARQNAYLSSLSGGSGVGHGLAFYQVHYPNLRARATASRLRGQNVYLYTEDPDSRGREGFSLVRFDLETGQEAGRAWVQERRPKMTFDPELGLVYVRRGLEAVEAITFEPAP